MIFKNLSDRPIRAFSSMALAVLLAACVTTPKELPVSIETATVPSADFSDLRTYYVLDVPPGENDVAPPKPFSRLVVEAAVRNELDTRNYREIDNQDAADMLVAIQFSLQNETRLKKQTTYELEQTVYRDPYYRSGYGNGYGYGSNRTYRSSRGNRGYSYGYGYREHYGYTAIPRTTVVAEDFRQGNMLIDLIDREENAVIWEAHASGEGETNLEKIELRVNSVVGQIFQRYPHVAAPS
ncbi:MAG: DUF4136 domain-containing protein [Hyphomonadaceae bacterium]